MLFFNEMKLNTNFSFLLARILLIICSFYLHAKRVNIRFTVQAVLHGLQVHRADQLTDQT